LLERRAAEPFDLATGPLYRVQGSGIATYYDYFGFLGPQNNRASVHLAWVAADPLEACWLETAYL
jgi:hypothetical protein